MKSKEMKNVINKIFSGEVDSEVHDDFVKFSKGVFENRYLLEGKKQASKWAVKSSSEFANYFVRKCLRKVSGLVEIKGIIVSTNKGLKEKFEFEIEGEKGYMGIKQFLINSSIEPEKILKLMEKYPKAFYALSFKTDNCELKIKAKAPKSGKPGKREDDGEPRADFCSLKTSDAEIVRDLFFDFPDFKEIKVNHTIEINNIDVDASIKDPVEMREKAVRLGKVVRKVVVDGKEKVSEKELVA